VIVEFDTFFGVVVCRVVGCICAPKLSWTHPLVFVEIETARYGQLDVNEIYSQLTITDFLLRPVLHRFCPPQLALLRSAIAAPFRRKDADGLFLLGAAGYIRSAGCGRRRFVAFWRILVPVCRAMMGLGKVERCGRYRFEKFEQYGVLRKMLRHAW